MKKDLAKINLTLSELVEAKMNDWKYEDYLSAGLKVLKVQHVSFWLLGKMVDSAEKKLGERVVEKLAKDLGIGRSSLYDYGKIYKTFGDNIFPPDGQTIPQLPYKTYLLASRTDNPSEWIKKSTEEGLTPSALEKEIKLADSKQYESHTHEWRDWKICLKCGLREEP